MSQKKMQNKYFDKEFLLWQLHGFNILWVPLQLIVWVPLKVMNAWRQGNRNLLQKGWKSHENVGKKNQEFNQ